MELKFKEQDYQIKAVDALVRCFYGQSKWELWENTLFKIKNDFWVAWISEEDFNACSNAPLSDFVRNRQRR